MIDMRHPLPEAYELVEHGHIIAGNFRDFTFANAIRLRSTQNPRFFEGAASPRKPPASSPQQTSTLAAAE